MSFFMRFVSFLMWRRLLALLTSFLLFAGLSFAIDDNLQNAQKDVKENIPISPNGSFGREKCDYSIKGKDSGILSARDFGAFPNDGKDDLPSIRSALAHAKKIGAKGISFEAGVYELHTPKGYTKELIFIDSMPNFSFLGAVSDKGEPKTVLRRVYEQKPHMELGSILRAYKSDNLTVGFTGDTGYCDTVDYMASICDYLICDCSFILGNESHMGIDDIKKLATKYPDHKFVTSHMFSETIKEAKKLKIKNIIVPNDGDYILKGE